MSKTLVMINEPFSQMVIGRNATLSYIVAALERGENVYIHNLPKTPKVGEAFPKDPKAKVEALEITKGSPLAICLVEAYKYENSQLTDVIEGELRKQNADAQYPFGKETLQVPKTQVSELLKQIAADPEASLELAETRKNITGISQERWQNIGTSSDSFLKTTEAQLSAAKSKAKKLEEKLAKSAQDKAVPTLAATSVELKNINIGLQRLEPMKAPFPPEGTESFEQALVNMRQSLPGLAISTPIGISDKENMQINADLAKAGIAEIATPTQEFAMGDADYSKAVEEMLKRSTEIFPDSKPKVVLKPKDSAQSCGVCAIEIDDEKGVNLEQLKAMKISDLCRQSHSFKSSVKGAEFNQMVEILLYAQRIETDPEQKAALGNKTAGEISEQEISEKAKELYNTKVLCQPFMQGVSRGDIRANIIKNENGEFVIDGYTFRASARKAGDTGFTTCYTTGAAVSAPVEFLTKKEQENLKTATETLLNLLNGKILGAENYKDRYKDMREMGVDFIPAGDKDETIYLGEINHTCPALGPISEALKEAMRRVQNPQEVSTYKCGTNYATKSIAGAFTEQCRGGSTVGKVTTTSEPLHFQSQTPITAQLKGSMVAGMN